MPAIRLTQLTVNKLAPPKTGRAVYWDRTLPGFGLRVTAAGAKSCICKTRVGTKQVFEALGTLARVPKVEDARELARISPGKAERRVNPAEEKRVEAARAAVNTVPAAVERYLAHCDHT